MITKTLSTEDKLISTIKGRVIELRTKLKNTIKADDRASIQTAIANNLGWLLNLGQKLDNMPELEEV
jgi:hypothetical protein